MQTSRKHFVFLFFAILSIFLITGCTQQNTIPPKPVCQNACDPALPVLCDKNAFYTCSDTNGDGCTEKTMIQTCPAGYSCKDQATCQSTTEDTVFTIASVNANANVLPTYTIRRPTPNGEQALHCTLLNRTAAYALGSCVAGVKEPEITSPSTPTNKYTVGCTQNCEQGVKLDTQSTQVNEKKDYLITASLQNMNTKKCTMQCTVLQGTVQKGTATQETFTLLPSIPQTLTFQTNTPTTFQFYCAEDPASATGCQDYIRQVFTTRYEVPPRTINATLSY